MNTTAPTDTSADTRAGHRSSIPSATDPGPGAVIRSEWLKFWSAKAPRRNLVLGTLLGTGLSVLISLVSALTFDDWHFCLSPLLVHAALLEFKLRAAPSLAPPPKPPKTQTLRSAAHLPGGRGRPEKHGYARACYCFASRYCTGGRKGGNWYSQKRRDGRF